MVRYRENDAVLGRCENISILEHAAGSRPLEQQRREGPLAGKFRSDLAVVGGTAWQAERNQTDDRKANGGKTNAEYTASEADYEPSCASRSF
jgi:hypothetical protein